jgi:branched-chain amino acid transport system substrate-binding protein
MAALLVNLPDIHALGLPSAKGLIFADSSYWEANDKTREWSKCTRNSAFFLQPA